MRTASTRVCGVAVGLLSAGLLGAATPVAAQTLEQALIAAYTYNPTLLAQRARLRSTDEQVPQALSNWRPDIELVTSVGAEVNQADTRTDPLINQRRDPKSLAITLTQPLFRGGRTLAATSGAENTVKAERARLEATEQQLLLDTVTAFMDVYRDRAVLELNLSNEQVLQRQLEATQDRFQVGEITRTDVHQAEARLSRSTADRIQSEGNLESSIATYRNLTSESPPDVLVLPEIPEDLPTAKDEALDLAAVNNPDLVAAQFDQRAALDGVDEVWGELLPVLEFSTSASRNLNSLAEESKQTTYEALVTLTVPIYQTGSVYSRLRAAKQTVAERLQRVDVERRNAVELATRSWEKSADRHGSGRLLRDADHGQRDRVRRGGARGGRWLADGPRCPRRGAGAPRLPGQPRARPARPPRRRVRGEVGNRRAHHPGVGAACRLLRSDQALRGGSLEGLRRTELRDRGLIRRDIAPANRLRKFAADGGGGEWFVRHAGPWPATGNGQQVGERPFRINFLDGSVPNRGEGRRGVDWENRLAWRRQVA